MKALLRAPPEDHDHLGPHRARPVVQPVGATQLAAIVEEILADPALRHVYFDISWDEVAKYLVATPEAAQRAADVINRYPDRFLFGTDEVAPTDRARTT